MRASLLSAAALLFALSAAVAADEPRAKPGTEPVDKARVAALIKEGTALHDRGDFDAAIRKYREALALDPDNADAMYEAAFSLYSKKDLRAAAEMANGALRGPKPSRGAAVLLGTIYDDMGESAQAIRVYRSALARDPDFYLLYYNLGIAYERAQKYSEARAPLENAVVLAPLHPGSHFALGRIYRAGGYRAPAIMAVARALSLEPKSERARGFVSWIGELFHLGVETDAKGNSKITINPDTPKDEGDFSGLEVLIPMIAVSRKVIPEAGGKLEGPAPAHELISLLKSVGELGIVAKGFAAEYYAAFYRELVKSDSVPGFVALALAGDKTLEMSAWTTEMEPSSKKASEIVARYRWTSAKRPALPDEPPAQAPTTATPR